MLSDDRENANHDERPLQPIITVSVKLHRGQMHVAYKKVSQ